MAIADIFIGSMEQYATARPRVRCITKVKSLIHPDWMTHRFGAPAHPSELILRTIWDREIQRDAHDPETLWVYCSPLPREYFEDSSLSVDSLSPVAEIDRQRQERYQAQLGNRLIVFPSNPWPQEDQLREALDQRSISLTPAATLTPLGVYFEKCVKNVGNTIKDGLRIADGHFLYAQGEAMSLSATNETEIWRWKQRQRARLRHKQRR